MTTDIRRAITPQPTARPLIRSVSDDQHEILRWIAQLHCGGSFHVDATYSRGGFYRNGVPEPSLKFDRDPQAPSMRQADCRDLPLPAASVNSIVFDPPFIHAAGRDSVIGQRFGDEKSQHKLRVLYYGAMAEFYRVLKPQGILVFKCQDIVESGRQVMNHCHIWEMANQLGFIDLDLFILTSPTRLIGHNHREQQHARRFHAYFWVFQKGPRR
jgi:hypothetical protein